MSKQHRQVDEFGVYMSRHGHYTILGPNGFALELSNKLPKDLMLDRICAELNKGIAATLVAKAELAEMFDRPAQVKPALQKLMNEPSVLEEPSSQGGEDAIPKQSDS